MGAIALIGAFVMLAVGAAITLLRPKDDGPANPPPPADVPGDHGPVPEVAVLAASPLAEA